MLTIELCAWTYIFPWIKDLEGFRPVIFKGALRCTSFAWATCLGQGPPADPQEDELCQARDDSQGGKGCAYEG